LKTIVLVYLKFYLYFICIWHYHPYCKCVWLFPEDLH